MVVELEVVLQVELEVELKVEDDDEEEEETMVVVEMEVEVELRPPSPPPCGMDGFCTWPTKTAPRAKRRRASPPRLGVPPLPGAVLRLLHLQELRPHALDLLLRHGPGVKGPDNGAHVLGRLDGREALEHEDLGGGDLRAERR